MLAGASISLLFLKCGKPMGESPQHTEPRTQPVTAPADEDCEPRKNDFQCEIRKGESDPLSVTFDPMSCGYCGDSVRQVLSDAGTPPVMDMDSGITTQAVTERPSETPENCPVDFHCGNGRRDFRRTYGSWIEPLADSGPDAGYVLGTRTITESIQDCPGDTRQNGHGGSGGGAPVEDEPLPLRQTASAWNCPSFVAPSQQVDMVDMHSNSVWSALSRIHGAINSNAAALRQALGAGATDRVVIRLNIRVEPRGYMSLNSISASCENRPCGDSQAIINATQLSLNGLVMGAPEMECFWTLTIRVPNA